jgi:DNA-binding IscR family transcriptional regulator
MRERLALNIMFLVGTAFRDKGQTVKIGDVSTALAIPSLALAPIAAGLEMNGLLTLTETEDLQPGRDMSRITLRDIMLVVRDEGETGSHSSPKWDAQVENLGAEIDSALASTVGERTLSDLLDDAV